MDLDSAIPKWKQYQEDVALFFRDLGLSAETDVTVQGARTKHNVDVLVESSYKGIPIKWVVECKRWNSAVSKEVVLALRMIVDDVGADRGFIMCEAGYQKGALEAAGLTSVQLTSLQDLRETCAQELAMARVKALYFRASELGQRYWNVDKETRIKHGLRPDTFEVGYSATSVLKASENALRDAIFYGFPVVYNEPLSHVDTHVRARFKISDGDVVLATPTELADQVGAKLNELDEMLRKVEAER